MERHIDFFNKSLIVIGLFITLSCNNDKQRVKIDEYYNFSFIKSETVDSIQFKSEIKLNNNYNNSVLYCAKIVKNENEGDIIYSNFIYKGKEYKTPKEFRNFTEYGFKYSLMPKYSEKNLIAKKYEFEKTSILLIKGENPFCNGNNCESYFLHLLILKDDTIKSNFIYKFNLNDIDIENFNFSIEKGVLLFFAHKNIIETFKI